MGSGTGPVDARRNDGKRVAARLIREVFFFPFNLKCVGWMSVAATEGAERRTLGSVVAAAAEHVG